jgi:hypothetical protein
MIQTGFESRVKVQQVIENQLPNFILDESPNTAEFLKQYYISQEYQGGVIDIAENLDQYLKLDNLTPEVVVDSTYTVSGISSTDNIVTVSSTKGFPQTYGLLKIDDEIITYTGITTNTFTGCIRGFSGVTNYHSNLNQEELVFSESISASHNIGSSVQNLSSLFLKEFYKKIKYTFTPGLEEVDFVSNLNVGNFIKEARSFYQAKGTDESFRILFNILYGVTPLVVNLEDFLIKPSSAEFIRREVVIAERISGDPSKLVGQTIRKFNDESTSASISEIEPFTRNNVQYFKISLFVGYDDVSAVLGNFTITPNTKSLKNVSIGSEVISVDSTIGFPEQGIIISGNNTITYTSKSINQFFGCSGITSSILSSADIRSDEIYFGYENGDLNKKVELRLTGVLSKFVQVSDTLNLDEGQIISVKNIGDLVENPQQNKTYKEIFANSWIYNTGSRYEIENINNFTLTSPIDRSSLKIGDEVEILERDSNIVLSSSGAYVSDIVFSENRVILDNLTFTVENGVQYDLRRKINTANSTIVPIQFGNNVILSDIQNLYTDDEYAYVTSNSLPSGRDDYNGNFTYKITKDIKTSVGIGTADVIDGNYTSIVFQNPVPFITGDRIYYQPSGTPIVGLDTGDYYVQVLDPSNKIKLYSSLSFVGTNSFLTFSDSNSDDQTFVNQTHRFTLYSQKSGIIGAQKLLKKFPLSESIDTGTGELTLPGSVGMLINGVEINNYKSNDKVYYGPLKSISVLNGGIDYDVINPPLISVSPGTGSTALVRPVVSGSIKKVYIDSQDYDINTIVSIGITGGNGSGCVLEPIITKRKRDILFDGRLSTNSGGISSTTNQLLFLTDHNLSNGELIVYNSNGNSSIGIGTENLTLVNNAIYYSKVDNNRTIKLFQTNSDYLSGINTVSFNGNNTAGIHKFSTAAFKNTISEIKILDSGNGYTNRELIVSSVGISTLSDTINFENHGFKSGELVTYRYETSTIGISTLSQYYVLKNNDDSFRLCDAGIGGTNISNYNRKNYVKFSSIGSGYQYFSYPNISVSIQYTPVGFVTTSQQIQSLVATPIVKGNIIDAYLYESGTGYGSTIVNLEKRPLVSIKTGNEAKLKPIIVNGQINSVNIQYAGVDYYSTPDLIVTDLTGSGSGADLRPVISNQKITDIKIVNPGIGYAASSTIIEVKSSGSNAILNANIRDLTVNNNNNLNFGDEILLESENQLQYSVCGYFENLRTSFGDDGSQVSNIIGWAYDGNPIYGPYGYSDSENSNSVPKRLESGYTLNPSNVIDRPLLPSGFFVEDYEYTNSGDLDENNGRFSKTPEFPNGVYAYFATLDTFSIPKFPYFIGNKYRSNTLNENSTLNQSFDFNNSNLLRNTLPYKVSDDYAKNDFIIETNEITTQESIVESVSEGYVSSFDIINSGSDYKINDVLNFDDTNTSGGGLIAIVSSIGGKDITKIDTSIETYENSIFTYNDGGEIKVTIKPYHNLSNNDYVVVSGFSTNLSKLNNSYKIGVSSYYSNVLKDIPTSPISGLTTEIYITQLPITVSVGSSIVVGGETLSVLEVYKNLNILKVQRGSAGVSHTATTQINFIPDSFTISQKIDYFESNVNDKVFFNPKQSVGVGTTPGITNTITFEFGDSNITRNVPTQGIYIENHPFKNNQQVIFTSNGTNISISTSPSSGTFGLPQNVYVTDKNKNTIGIKTNLNSSEVFFTTNGDNNDKYSFESVYPQIVGRVERIKSTVSVSTSHELSNSDIISLNVKPNLSVGIGTSTGVRVKRNSILDSIVINSIEITSSDINTTTKEITIPSHEFNTGDKVVYVTNKISGEANEIYYVYKVDNNTIKLCETLIDSLSTPPVSVLIYPSTSILTFGSLEAGVAKWSGGVLAPNGKIYGIPFDATEVLEIDPVGLTTSTFGSLGVDAGKWSGGVLALNGKIYGIPLSATEVLEIDPVNRTTSTFGSLGVDLFKWIGGSLAPNGKIYAIPGGGTTTEILEIDPVNRTTSTFGSLGIDTLNWVGSVLAPNGKIYGIPYNSTQVLEIDPVGLTTSTFGSLVGSSKWSGGVLAPNGKIYGIPSNATQVLEIDPVGLTTSTFGSLGGDANKWYGGVLAPNGKIYGIPSNATQVLEIDPVGLTTSTFGSLGGDADKWYEGVLAPNGKIYGIPLSATEVLEIDKEQDDKEIQRVNPQILSIKNNNLVFDLSDSSLSDYKFKVFYDQNFKNEFISTGDTPTFSVSGVGTIGVSTNASLTINYSEGLPTQLYYNLEKSGYISTSDTEVNNYSEILFVDSVYNSNYKISGIGSTTFIISLSKKPEKLTYIQNECDKLQYTTTSLSAKGSIDKINIISGGAGYKKLPTFVGSNSLSGKDAYITPKSISIGNVKEVRIINEGFQYSSDKTLQPIALISPLITIKNSNTIGIITVTSGGKGYTDAPSIIIANSSTGEKIDSGILEAKLSGNSIDSVSILQQPKGLPETTVQLFATNNTNGISIQQVQSSSSGIFTCFITTPTLGFSTAPFSIGDKVFVEAIQKSGSEGTGFNSEDYGYQFFTVDNYSNAGTLHSVTIDISELTTNTGIAKTIQDSVGNIIKSIDYPSFNVAQIQSQFIVGEKLISNNTERDLKISSYENSFIKVSGTYELSVGEIIIGKESGNIATIDKIESGSGRFKVDYSVEKNIGWSNDIGKLDQDNQVIPDNDYYQNLSYTVKSPITYQELRTPVNSLLHTSGLKNFADTGITSITNSGTITSNNATTIIYDIIEENRVDTIYDFDLVKDIDIVGDSSKFLKLKNKKLTDYIECRSNVVLKIDDINRQFSDAEGNPSQFVNLLELNSAVSYDNILVRVSSLDNTEIQLTELVLLNDGSNSFLAEKSTIVNTGVGLTHISGELIGEFILITDDADDNTYLRFIPNNPFNIDYDIKIINTNFNSTLSGIGTISIGFINLTGSNRTSATGIQTPIISVESNKFSSLYSNIQIIDSVTNQMNFAEVYLNHDGEDTYISEYYFDSEFSSNYYSGNNIGIFTASISPSGILSLNYINNSSNPVNIRSKVVGFGTTSVGTGVYRFISPGQIPGNERSAAYQSTYSSTVSSASTVISLDKSNFNAVKSLVEVSVGSTSALHQIMLVQDQTNIYVQQSPFLSVGSTNGIGTFGGEYSGGNFILKFYPDPSITSKVNILSFSQCLYKDLDTQNTAPILSYGTIEESIDIRVYNAINGSRINRTDFNLNSNGIKIFAKTFDPTNLTILNPSTGVFNIQNHFFSNLEELIYTPKSTFIGVGASAVGIGSTLNSVGVVTTILPSEVYVIKLSDDAFKLSTRKDYAALGIAVTFTSYGSGNAHQLEMDKKLEKSLITIDNVVQYPLLFTPISYTLLGNGGQISAGSSIFSLSGISTIAPKDILKIDNEYVGVVNVGLGTTNVGPITNSGNINLVEVSRAFVGSSATTHTDTTSVRIYKGSYNIVDSNIFFAESPRGNPQIIKDSSNLTYETSDFTGRVFLRNNYTSNQLYDDISNQFTGIGRTFTLTVGGANTVGLGTSGGNGILFINGVFQTPTTINNPQNNFSIIENTVSGISSVVFSGVRNPDNLNIITSEFDINQNQTPRGGIIISLGSSTGLGYAPLVGAAVTAVVGAGGSIVSVGLGTTDNLGSGYNGIVSIGVSVYQSGHIGDTAIITASVGAGGTLSFTVGAGGTGYTNPKIFVSEPSYENLNVTGVSRLGVGATTTTGIGLLLNVEVGASSTTGIGSTYFEVSRFSISRQGYSFRRGDVFKPVGLVTAKGLASPLSEFQLTVVDTFSDSFASWQFGEFDYIDSIKNYQDGVRTRFPLFYNNELLSFESLEGSQVNLSNALLIVINGVIQDPGVAYEFDGGTSFVFTTAPRPEDNVAIFFYKGTDGDDVFVNDTINETLKRGDTVQVLKNNSIPGTITQDKRTIFDLSFSDKFETNLYSNQGVDSENNKPLSWIKQKVDRKINGEDVYKTRDSIESLIYPTAKIIKDFSTTSDEIFVDNAEFFEYDNPEPFSSLIVNGISTTASGAVELISNITVTNVNGFSGIITGIGTTTGSGGNPLALRFYLNSPSFVGLSTGYPIYIFDTRVGRGVTSIHTSNSAVVGIGTTFVDNIYYIHQLSNVGNVGIITCNILSTTSTVGLVSIGNTSNPVGKFSWGRMSGFTRSSSPISIGVTGNTVDVGLTTFATIQRRGIGIRQTGALPKLL